MFFHNVWCSGWSFQDCSSSGRGLSTMGHLGFSRVFPSAFSNFPLRTDGAIFPKTRRRARDATGLFAHESRVVAFGGSWHNCGESATAALKPSTWAVLGASCCVLSGTAGIVAQHLLPPHLYTSHRQHAAIATQNWKLSQGPIEQQAICSLCAVRKDLNTRWFQLTKADCTCGHGTESAWMLFRSIFHIVPGLFQTKRSVVHTLHPMIPSSPILHLSFRAWLATIAEAIVCRQSQLTTVGTTFSASACSTKHGLGVWFQHGRSLKGSCINTVAVDSW